MQISKLTLGTAQLGQKYGISNKNGQPSLETANHILDTAFSNGVNCIDTAPAYGNSEKIIGEYCNFHMPDVTVISKFPSQDAKNKNNDTFKVARDAFFKTMNDLGMACICIYLFHDVRDMVAYYPALVQLQEEGYIIKLGVSVYTPEELTYALGYDKIEAIQVPINLYDHRFIPMISTLKGKIIFARSIYLQGAFFVNNFAGLSNKLTSICKKYGVSVDRLALAFVRDLPNITSLVIGAETTGQLLRNIQLMGSPPLETEVVSHIFKEFNNVPLDFIDPRRWKK